MEYIVLATKNQTTKEMEQWQIEGGDAPGESLKLPKFRLMVVSTIEKRRKQ
jgi:hypothetical protein